MKGAPKGEPLLFIGDKPLSLLKLKESGILLGFRLSFFAAANSALPPGAHNLIKRPFLALFKANGGTHLVVVKRYRFHRYEIFDPAVGYLSLLEEDFLYRFANVIGTATRIGGSRKKKEKRRLSRAPDNHKAVAALFSFLSILSLALGLFFVSGTDEFWPLSLFAAAGIFQILQRFSLSKAMKRFDSLYLSGIDSEEPRRFKENYLRYLSYRKASIVDPLSSLWCLLTFLALTFLFAFNEPYFLAAVAGVVAYSLVESLFLRKKPLQQSYDLEKDEKTLLAASQSGNRLLKAKALIDQSFSLLNAFSNLEIVRFFGLLALSFLPSLITNDFSLNYYLFHFFALYALGEQASEIFRRHESAKRRSSDRSYFLDYILKGALDKADKPEKQEVEPFSNDEKCL